MEMFSKRIVPILGIHFQHKSSIPGHFFLEISKHTHIHVLLILMVLKFHDVCIGVGKTWKELSVTLLKDKPKYSC